MLEVYNEWCGPCRAINNTCKRLYFDHGDKGLKFYTTPAGALPATTAFKGKCKPVFLFYRNGEELADQRLEGVDTPAFVNAVLKRLEGTA